MTEPGDGESVTTADPAEEDPSVEESADSQDDHLADVEEGAGCTEIWEHLSEQREAADD